VKKWWFPALTALALLNGCATVPRGSIPVVDSGTRVSNSERVQANRTGNAPVRSGTSQAQSVPQDSGVTVMIPQGSGATPIQTFPASTAPSGISAGPITPGPVTSEPFTPQPSSNAGSYTMPSAPTGIPRASSSAGGLSADEQLDGPVLALLTTAQQQQGSGDYNGASSSLERAQRIAPREPQVLYRLAQVRLAQGDAAQSEQLARRALTYANGRPDLQSGLWNIIAQAREKQGDAAGAAQARQKAQATL
jgi:hypothetical protein